jgi:hypothetical protein
MTPITSIIANLIQLYTLNKEFLVDSTPSGNILVKSPDGSIKYIISLDKNTTTSIGEYNENSKNT